MRLLTSAFFVLLLFVGRAAAAPLAWTGPVPDDLNAESHFVEIKGNTWHYVSSGEGPPLVLLHGLPMQSYLWRGVIPELAKTHRVIVPDLLGYGRSDKGPSIDFGAHAQAAHFADFMDALDLGEPAILGVSDLGSLVGLYWASQNEADVAGLILIEAAIYSGEQFYRAAPGQMKRLFTVFGRNPELARRLLVDKNILMKVNLQAHVRRTLSEAERAEYARAWADPAVRERVLMAAGPSSMPPKGRTTDPTQGTALMDVYGPWLTETDLPKLVLTARPGFLIGRDDVKYIRANFPNTTIVDVGKAKHFVQEDQPEAISAAAAAWLSGLP